VYIGATEVEISDLEYMREMSFWENWL